MPPAAKDRAPDCLARALDAHARPVGGSEPRWAAFSRPRRILGAQRIELGDRKTRAEILAGLAHRRGDRAAAVHRGERVDGAIRPGRPTGFVDAFRRRPDREVAADRMVRDAPKMMACPIPNKP
jgi:hypothetical protein